MCRKRYADGFIGTYINSIDTVCGGVAVITGSTPLRVKASHFEESHMSMFFNYVCFMICQYTYLMHVFFSVWYAASSALPMLLSTMIEFQIWMCKFEEASRTGYVYAKSRSKVRKGLLSFGFIPGPLLLD